MMNTLLLNANNHEDIQTAGNIIKQGGLVAIPTETVYGLAANALDECAVSHIYTAKGRPADNPLIVHISQTSQLDALVKEVPVCAIRLAERFWPGPLTIILRKAEGIPEIVSGGLDTVAVRLPSNQAARAVIDAAGVPLAAPSANLSGKPSPTKYAHVKADLYGKIEAIMDGGDCAVGVESTVISLVGEHPVILRPGGITKHELASVLGEVQQDRAVIGKIPAGAQVRSPGMKYKHYAPETELTIVDASPKDFTAFVNAQADTQRRDAPAIGVLCFDADRAAVRVPAVSYGKRYDGTEQASRLFDALRQLDGLRIKSAYVQIPAKNGIGLAVYNRLLRAAAFRVINPMQRHIIGLTGGSGTGKTMLSEEMKALGCAIIDCDAVSKLPDVYGPRCLSKLQAAFGADIVENGVLNRPLLAERAFSTPEGKVKLNEITHPEIYRKILELIAALERERNKLIVLDAPTLFESGFDRNCSRIIAVSARREVRIQRILTRDGMDRAAADKRINAQMEDAYYTARADYIIHNDGSRAEAKAQLTPIIKTMLELPPAKG